MPTHEHTLRSKSFDVEEAKLGDDAGTVYVSKAKLKELGLKDGCVVRLRGKKRRETVALLAVDKHLTDAQIRAGRAMRGNLRVRVGDVITVTMVKPSSIAKAQSVEVLAFAESIMGLQGDHLDQRVKPHFTAVAKRPILVGDTFLTPDGGEFQIANAEAEEEKEEKGGKKKSEEEQGEGEGEGEEEADASSKETKVFWVDEQTEFTCDGTPIQRSEDGRNNEIGYDDIGGCRKQLASIRELVELPLRHPEVFNSIGIPPPRGVLLHGPSGTGKTSLARAVAAETGAYFYVLNGPEIMSKQSGDSESNLRKAFEEAEKNSPAIIFIDEIDAIAPRRDKAGGETEKRIVSQLLTLFDGIKRTANVVVIAATNRPNIIEPALRRFGRFDRELQVTQPEEDGRLEILRIKTRDMKLAPNCDLRLVAKSTHGYVGADLSQVCMEAAFRAIREVLPYINIDEEGGSLDPLLLQAIEITDAHFEGAIAATNPSSLRESVVEVPDVSWDDIGGLEDVKRELKELVQLPVEYGHLFEKFGTASSKGVLFYGPPGCGKTLLAKAIATEAGANFISIKGPELLDSHIGESEANVRALFDKARAAAPCILFFDEMDSIAKARGGGGGGSGLGDNVINQILTEIDSVESRKSVFIIGATNRPDILDTSVTRPGHLDQLVYIPLPDLLSRISIFKANLRKCPVDPGVDVIKLAKATEGFSGADITEICQRAAKNAIREDIALDVAAAAAELANLSEEEKKKQQSGGGKKKRSTTKPSKPTHAGVACIRKDHFEDAMARARRSVSDADIDKYKSFIKKQANEAKDAGSFTFAQAEKDLAERQAAEAAASSSNGGAKDDNDEQSLYT